MVTRAALRSGGWRRASASARTHRQSTRRNAFPAPGGRPPPLAHALGDPASMVARAAATRPAGPRAGRQLGFVAAQTGHGAAARRPGGAQHIGNHQRDRRCRALPHSGRADGGVAWRIQLTPGSRSGPRRSGQRGGAGIKAGHWQRPGCDGRLVLSGWHSSQTAGVTSLVFSASEATTLMRAALAGGGIALQPTTCQPVPAQRRVAGGAAWLGSAGDDDLWRGYALYPRAGTCHPCGASAAGLLVQRFEAGVPW